jgi:hypothetical protein
MEYERDEHRVHLIVYHLVWTPQAAQACAEGQGSQRLPPSHREQV